MGCSPSVPTDGYGTVLFVSLESINLSILLHAVQRHGDKADGGEQFIIHPAPGLHAPQLPQDGGELVTQGLVDPGIALHYNVPVQQPPGDVVLLGQPGQADGNLNLFVFLRGHPERYGLASPSVVVVEIFRRHDLSPLSLHVQLVRHLRLPGGEQVSVAVGDVDTLMPHPVSDCQGRKAHVNQQGNVAVSIRYN